MLVRLCQPVLLVALLFGSLASAQTPPPPPTTPPSTTPPTTTTPPTAGGEAARPATPTQGQEPQGTGRQRQGRGGGQQGRGGGKSKSQDLPEFTPVAAPPLAGLQGKQYFWFTMYPDYLVKFDPQTDTVTTKVKLIGGMFWRTTLTHDRKRMLVVTNQQQSIEVVDLKTGKLAGSHLFEEEGFILRIRNVRECPGGVCWLVQTDRVKKEIDRYSFEASQWLLYDSAKQKVLRKLKKLPDGLSRARLSADGSHWLASDRDGNLTFLDARTFKEQAKIDLKTPRFFGAGSIRLTSTDLLDGRDPTRARMLFSSTDPVEKRRTSWGVIELDLTNKSVTSVTEWGPNRRSFGMRVAHRPLVAAYMGRGRDNKSQLVKIDLRTGKKIAEALHEFRPRRSLVAIAPDASKVYVGVAGSDFEVFDKDLKRLPSVELEGEIVGRIHVVDG